MEDNKTRNSNLELLRIVSMFLIVIFHVIVHGHVIDNTTNSGLKLVVLAIEFFTLVHVNSFILISGYFQSEGKFKFSKVWQLINSSLFYKIGIIIVFSILGIASFSKAQILKEAFILNLEQYWYIKNFLFLYCISPFLNRLIKNLSQKEYLKMLFVLTIIVSIIPYITGTKGFDNNGFTLHNFIFLYFIGAYLRKYPMDKSYIFKKCSKHLFQLILISIFLFCMIFNLTLFITATQVKDFNSIFQEIFGNLEAVSVLYCNPLVIIQSIAYFLFFATLDFKSKFVNLISSLTLGIYLLHDNNYMQTRIYNWLNINQGGIHSYRFILYLFLVAAFIFVSCAIVEYIRQVIFRFIYKRNISKKVRDKYHSWISSIGFLK